MSVYFFVWNPEKDQDSFEDFDDVQQAAVRGQPYLTDWICRSTRPQPGDIAIMQRTGSKDNGVFAKGIVEMGTYVEDDGKKHVKLSLTSFLPIGQEIPRKEIRRRAKYTKNWCPMSSGEVAPEQIVRAIDAIWEERTGKAQS